MQIVKKPSRQEWPELLKRPEIDTTSLFGTVGEVLENIRQNGDRAVIDYELKFDKVQLSSLQVTEEEIAEAEPQVPHLLKEAISQAKRNIEKFHDAQNDDLPYMNVIPEVRCWQKRVAIQKVGLYIPGGTAPLFSTVLMLQSRLNWQDARK